MTFQDVWSALNWAQSSSVRGKREELGWNAPGLYVPPETPCEQALTMSANDSGPTRADVELEGRYAAVSDCTGRTLMYDLENDDAWIRSDAALDPTEWQ